MDDGEFATAERQRCAPEEYYHRKGNLHEIATSLYGFSSMLNPKAALEETSSASFFCFTTGDTIMVIYNKEFQVNIVETKPYNAISIIDTDCDVDFVPHLDNKEPSKEGHKFVPFTGLSRRLDEKTAAELALPDSGSVEKENQTINTAPSMATESEIRSRKHPTEVVWFMLAQHMERD